MILIVDDDTWSIGPLKDALEMEGFKTFVVAEPHRCLEVVSGKEPERGTLVPKRLDSIV